MYRPSIPPEFLDWAKWPKIMPDLRPEDQRKQLHDRCEAMRLYVQGAPHKTIETQTGMNRTAVWKLFRRCIESHPDGNFWGLRACLRYVHVKKYERKAPSVAAQECAQYGHSGELGRLFERFPHIAQAVLAEARSCGRGAHEPILRVSSIHGTFLRLCREAKIPLSAYPFNVIHNAERALARWLRQELAKDGVERMVDVLFGEEAADRLGFTDVSPRSGARYLPYERVEIDGHRIDALMVIEIDDPKGGEPHVLAMERIWILAAVDVASRAVLGYHIALGRKYSAEDLLQCIENSIRPWKRRELIIPTMGYPEGAGFPSGVIAELAYAKFGCIAFDNDVAHRAARVTERLEKGLGTSVNLGPVKTPDSRQFIERLFRTMTQNGFQRLPSTTGSHQSDPKRRKPEEAALHFRIRFEEIADLAEVLLATYNAEGHHSLGGKSPLEYLRVAVDRQSFFIRQIAEEDRARPCLTLIRQRAKVRGNLKKGERGFVEFAGARYYSAKLSDSVALIGKPVWLEIDTKEVRMVRMFLENGMEFGLLTVADAWASAPHDLRTRKAMLRMIATGRIARRGVDHVHDYMKFKEAESLKTKKARNELAHLRRSVANEKQQTAGTAPEKEAAVKTPVRPKLPRVIKALPTSNF